MQTSHSTRKVLETHVKSRLCIYTNTWSAYAMDLCTMHCVPSNQNALMSTCRRILNANYASNHHKSMSFNQTKCSLMHEHVIDDARCINSWPICKVNTNAQEYMHVMYKNPHTDTNKVAKSNSNQGIQERKLSNQNLH